MNVYNILLTRHVVLFIVYILVIVNLVLIYFIPFKFCCAVLFYDLFQVELSSDKTLGPMKHEYVCMYVCN